MLKFVFIKLSPGSGSASYFINSYKSVPSKILPYSLQIEATEQEIVPATYEDTTMHLMDKKTSYFAIIVYLTLGIRGSQSEWTSLAVGNAIDVIPKLISKLSGNDWNEANVEAVQDAMDKVWKSANSILGEVVMKPPVDIQRTLQAVGNILSPIQIMTGATVVVYAAHQYENFNEIKATMARISKKLVGFRVQADDIEIITHQLTQVITNIRTKLSGLQIGNVKESEIQVLEDELTKGYGLVKEGKIKIGILLRELETELSEARNGRDTAGGWLFANSMVTAGAIAAPFAFGVAPLIAIPFGVFFSYLSYDSKTTQWQADKIIETLENLQQQVVGYSRDIGKSVVTMDGMGFELKYWKAQVNKPSDTRKQG